RNAKLQGYVRPLVTATTRILWPSAVSNSIGNFGKGRSARPVGATGMLFRNGTCCCTSARSSATYAAIFINKRSLCRGGHRPPLQFTIQKFTCAASPSTTDRENGRAQPFFINLSYPFWRFVC